MTKQKYYAVKKGRETGIFTDWNCCQKSTTGFPGAVFKSFESKKAAETFLSDVDIAVSTDIAPLLQLDYYAVKKGRETGIFTDWSSCQEAITGFPGAIFKSFKNKEAAEAFLSDADIVVSDDIATRLQQGRTVAFVDGSFDGLKGYYSYGIVIINNNMEETELCGKSNNAKFLAHNNVAGEIFGVVGAMDWALQNNCNKLSIFHDLEGLARWADGSWKTNNDLTKFYQSFIEKYKGVIDLEFVKVKGHSNNKYNDRADQLAREAIFENKTCMDASGNGVYIIDNIKEQ
ncbi:MAG: ribonuclease H family protein [Christensenellaceae bacterium]|nr:ribonuclease H family protein [Christensenellaceae bacterium]